MAKDTKSKVSAIGVLTSGGDAPGMNAVIRAVVRRGRSKGLKTMGIYRGYEGLMNDEVRELAAKDVSDIIQRGGTILNTARCAEMRTDEGLQRAADACRRNGIEGLVVIGGDGSFAGAQKLANLGINTIGVPDTSASHERVSIIEVMGRNAGYIALWAGIGAGAEDILLPEKYDYDEQRIINNIIETRRKGKKHHIIINAEGIGHSAAMASRIEAATGIETRATILGYMQRGGSPTSRDRVCATVMGAYAVDLLIAGKTKRVVAYKDGHVTDFDINEALAMQKDIDPYEYELSHALSYDYSKI